MARERDTRLGETLVRLLDGTDLATKVGITMQLITVGPEGVPHTALLSVGEVLATSATTVRLALWGTSRTTGNLTERPRALLTAVVDRAHVGIELRASRLPWGPEGTEGLAAFAAEVAQVHVDRVGYAELTSGITYRLHDRESVVERWQRTIAALRAAPGPDPAGRGNP